MAELTKSHATKIVRPRDVRILDTHLQGNIFPGFPVFSLENVNSIFYNLVQSDYYDENHFNLLDYDKRNREVQFSYDQFEELMIDFDWRFSNYTIDMILNIIQGRGKVLLLGTPMIYLYLRYKYSFDATLIERNNLYSAFGGVINKSLYDVDVDSFAGSFDAVVLDPPWYLPDIIEWTDFAMRAVSDTGVVVSNVFPPNVRPSGHEELRQYFDICKYAFEDVAYFVSVYNTPRFEKEVLSRSGKPYLENWRRGLSLVLHNKTGSYLSQNHGLGRAQDRSAWFRQLTAGGEVEAVKLSTQELGELDYRFVDSVSRRNPLWESIQVINSRNMAGINDVK